MESKKSCFGNFWWLGVAGAVERSSYLGVQLSQVEAPARAGSGRLSRAAGVAAGSAVERTQPLVHYRGAGRGSIRREEGPRSRQRELEAVRRGLLSREWATRLGQLVLDRFLAPEHLDAAVWLERLKDRITQISAAPGRPQSVDFDRVRGRATGRDDAKRDRLVLDQWKFVTVQIGRNFAVLQAAVFKDEIPATYEGRLALRVALGEVLGICRQYGQLRG